MKKLFTVKDNSTNKTVDQYFDKKPDAKELRDSLNKECATENRFTVTLGPDHKRF
jgi:hypothetical protein